MRDRWAGAGITTTTGTFTSKGAVLLAVLGIN